eukprot:g2950.t1
MGGEGRKTMLLKYCTLPSPGQMDDSIEVISRLGNLSKEQISELFNDKGHSEMTLSCARDGWKAIEKRYEKLLRMEEKGVLRRRRNMTGTKNDLNEKNVEVDIDDPPGMGSDDDDNPPGIEEMEDGGPPGIGSGSDKAKEKKQKEETDNHQYLVEHGYLHNDSTSKLTMIQQMDLFEANKFRRLAARKFDLLDKDGTHQLSYSDIMRVVNEVFTVDYFQKFDTSEAANDILSYEREDAIVKSERQRVVNSVNDMFPNRGRSVYRRVTKKSFLDMFEKAICNVIHTRHRHFEHQESIAKAMQELENRAVGLNDDTEIKNFKHVIKRGKKIFQQLLTEEDNGRLHYNTLEKIAWCLFHSVHLDGKIANLWEIKPRLILLSKLCHLEQSLNTSDRAIEFPSMKLQKFLRWFKSSCADILHDRRETWRQIEDSETMAEKNIFEVAALGKGAANAKGTHREVFMNLYYPIEQAEEAAAIEGESPEETHACTILLQKAYTEFHRISNGKETLVFSEVRRLAEWTWSQFHPQGEPLSKEEKDTSTHALLTQYDTNLDGVLQWKEFVHWFRLMNRQIKILRKHRNDLQASYKARKQEQNEKDVQYQLRKAFRSAENEFLMLDADGDDYIDLKDARILLSRVWKNLHHNGLALKKGEQVHAWRQLKKKLLAEYTERLDVAERKGRRKDRIKGPQIQLPEFLKFLEDEYRTLISLRAKWAEQGMIQDILGSAELAPFNMLGEPRGTLHPDYDPFNSERKIRKHVEMKRIAIEEKKKKEKLQKLTARSKDALPPGLIFSQPIEETDLVTILAKNAASPNSREQNAKRSVHDDTCTPAELDIYEVGKSVFGDNVVPDIPEKLRIDNSESEKEANTSNDEEVEDNDKIIRRWVWEGSDAPAEVDQDTGMPILHRRSKDMLMSRLYDNERRNRSKRRYTEQANAEMEMTPMQIEQQHLFSFIQRHDICLETRKIRRSSLDRAAAFGKKVEEDKRHRKNILLVFNPYVDEKKFEIGSGTRKKRHGKAMGIEIASERDKNQCFIVEHPPRHSCAYEKGVSEGWIVREVNGICVPKEYSTAMLQAAIDKAWNEGLVAVLFQMPEFKKGDEYEDMGIVSLSEEDETKMVEDVKKSIAAQKVLDTSGMDQIQLVKLIEKSFGVVEDDKTYDDTEEEDEQLTPNTLKIRKMLNSMVEADRVQRAVMRPYLDAESHKIEMERLRSAELGIKNTNKLLSSPRATKFNMNQQKMKALLEELHEDEDISQLTLEERAERKDFYLKKKLIEKQRKMPLSAKEKQKQRIALYRSQLYSTIFPHLLNALYSKRMEEKEKNENSGRQELTATQLADSVISGGMRRGTEPDIKELRYRLDEFRNAVMSLQRAQARLEADGVSHTVMNTSLYPTPSPDDIDALFQSLVEGDSNFVTARGMNRSLSRDDPKLLEKDVEKLLVTLWSEGKTDRENLVYWRVIKEQKRNLEARTQEVSKRQSKAEQRERVQKAAADAAYFSLCGAKEANDVVKYTENAVATAVKFQDEKEKKLADLKDSSAVSKADALHSLETVAKKMDNHLNTLTLKYSQHLKEVASIVELSSPAEVYHHVHSRISGVVSNLTSEPLNDVLHTATCIAMDEEERQVNEGHLNMFHKKMMKEAEIAFNKLVTGEEDSIPRNTVLRLNKHLWSQYAIEGEPISKEEFEHIEESLNERLSENLESNLGRREFLSWFEYEMNRFEKYRIVLSGIHVAAPHCEERIAVMTANEASFAASTAASLDKINRLRAKRRFIKSQKKNVYSEIKQLRGNGVAKEMNVKRTTAAMDASIFDEEHSTVAPLIPYELNASHERRLTALADKIHPTVKRDSKGHIGNKEVVRIVENLSQVVPEDGVPISSPEKLWCRQKLIKRIENNSKGTLTRKELREFARDSFCKDLHIIRSAKRRVSMLAPRLSDELAEATALAAYAGDEREAEEAPLRECESAIMLDFKAEFLQAADYDGTIDASAAAKLQDWLVKPTYASHIGGIVHRGGLEISSAILNRKLLESLDSRLNLSECFEWIHEYLLEIFRIKGAREGASAACPNTSEDIIYSAARAASATVAAAATLLPDRSNSEIVSSTPTLRETSDAHVLSHIESEFSRFAKLARRQTLSFPIREQILSLGVWALSHLSVEEGDNSNGKLTKEETNRFLRDLRHILDGRSEGSCTVQEFSKWYLEKSDEIFLLRHAEAEVSLSLPEDIDYNDSLAIGRGAAKGAVRALIQEKAFADRREYESRYLALRAHKKWGMMDANHDKRLDRQEIQPFLAWVWTSFHPGGKRIKSNAVRKILEKNFETDSQFGLTFSEFVKRYQAMAQAVYRLRATRKKMFSELESMQDDNGIIGHGAGVDVVEIAAAAASDAVGALRGHFYNSVANVHIKRTGSISINVRS